MYSYYHIEIFGKFTKLFCSKIILGTKSVGLVAVIFITLFNSLSQTVEKDRKH